MKMGRSFSLDATIELDGKFILGTRVNITELQDSQGRSDWTGTFTIPAREIIEPGEYRIVLEDGRSGFIIIAYAPSSSNSAMTGYFEGNGPLS